MFDRERRREEDMRRSEAMPHYKSEEDMRAEKLPDNYKPHRTERDEETRPREMFSMEHSYGDVAVSANRNQELTVSISENRRHDSPSLENDQKKLDGERRRAVNYDIGSAFTDRFDQETSAFVFKTTRMQPEKQVFERIKKHVNEKGQDTVEDILPFFSLDRDRKLLDKLAEESRGAREQDQDPAGFEQEAGHLARSVSQKEQMQSRFINKMRLAVTKARVITGEDRAVLHFLPNFHTDQDMPETPPEDDADLLAAVLLAAPSKKGKPKKNK